jgi:hypothetical protein
MLDTGGHTRTRRRTHIHGFLERDTGNLETEHPTPGERVRLAQAGWNRARRTRLAQAGGVRTQARPARAGRVRRVRKAQARRVRCLGPSGESREGVGSGVGPADGAASRRWQHRADAAHMLGPVGTRGRRVAAPLAMLRLTAGKRGGARLANASGKRSAAASVAGERGTGRSGRGRERVRRACSAQGSEWRKSDPRANARQVWPPPSQPGSCCPLRRGW